MITTLRERYPELVIGLSDHHNGIAMAPVAYMLGARAFEKHFTLNHAWKGTDHAYSLMPDGMRRFVRDLQRVPTALGDGVKRRLPSEERPLAKMGKKLVAARDLPAGHVLAPGDLVAKSPADGGLPPYELDRLLGRRAAAAARVRAETSRSTTSSSPRSSPPAALAKRDAIRCSTSPGASRSSRGEWGSSARCTREVSPSAGCASRSST